VLGKHPKLTRLKLERDVNALDKYEAGNRLRNIRTYISRDSKKLRKMKAGPEKEVFKTKLANWETERDLLEKKIA